MAPLIYLRGDNGFVVVASKGGAPAHPAWHLNLINNPGCEIRVGHPQYHAIACTNEGDERAALWEKMAEIYPPYNAYQPATERKIPVVVLEPVEKTS